MSQLILLDRHLSESYLKKKITYKIKDFFFLGGGGGYSKWRIGIRTQVFFIGIITNSNSTTIELQTFLLKKIEDLI